MQNDGDLLDLIIVYMEIWVITITNKQLLSSAFNMV